MKRLFGGLARALFDVRVVVALAGTVLSIVMHEILHIILHWGEITSIHLFSNPRSIVEIIFTPAHDYNLFIEEICAYAVSGLTLLLTAMLIHDLHDQQDTRTVGEIVLGEHSSGTRLGSSGKETQVQLLRLLNLQ